MSVTTMVVRSSLTAPAMRDLFNQENILSIAENDRAWLKRSAVGNNEKPAPRRLECFD